MLSAPDTDARMPECPLHPRFFRPDSPFPCDFCRMDSTKEIKQPKEELAAGQPSSIHNDNNASPISWLRVPLMPATKHDASPSSPTPLASRQSSNARAVPTFPQIDTAQSAKTDDWSGFENTFYQCKIVESRERQIEQYFGAPTVCESRRPGGTAQRL